jgi:hypothetical protein
MAAAARPWPAPSLLLSRRRELGPVAGERGTNAAASRRLTQPRHLRKGMFRWWSSGAVQQREHKARDIDVKKQPESSISDGASECLLLAHA